MFPFSDSDLVTRIRPIVNVTFIAICTAIFVYELIIGDLGRLAFFYQFGMIPAELAQCINYDSLVTPAGTLDISSPIPNWITILTSMFIHGDWMHFATNMLFLWVFGDNIEDRFGHFRYLFFYLMAGVAAAFLQLVVDIASEAPTIGASGAIAGVLGAYLFLFPYSRVKTFVLFFFITFVRIPAIYLLGFWFVIQFIGGIGSLGPSTQIGGIAYWAHIGGFAFGIIVVISYKLITRQRLWPIRPETKRYWRGREL